MTTQAQAQAPTEEMPDAQEQFRQWVMAHAAHLSLHRMPTGLFSEHATREAWTAFCAGRDSNLHRIAAQDRLAVERERAWWAKEADMRADEASRNADSFGISAEGRKQWGFAGILFEGFAAHIRAQGEK